ncbi:Asp-tRNA(Asn)/Glu-tRNA(Gln) amidotransferase GatCAB subunit C [Candidatus Peregrinibacteria bacterium HGW-Peregrinibacteria-1]|jgi:aspartyl-tRNA(Asn)/glutamyl-tRNA(Gln) amidotransferase subunit C|nr:MAG: Asp-tRNA(Asn)/Glu-tRNA(Gln) amidotransferase GatCAB subunit C [Candidatus Peregrinibacteria bacterium HGW-Peregrinibacteria-1]
MLTEKEVRHVAKLARLGLSDEEVERFKVHMNGVLEYVEVLQELDTTGVELTAQVTGLKNVMREDEIDNQKCTREELLATSEMPVDSSQIRVKRTI